MINNKEAKKDARVALIFAVKSSGLTKDSSKMACELLTATVISFPMNWKTKSKA